MADVPSNQASYFPAGRYEPTEHRDAEGAGDMAAVAGRLAHSAFPDNITPEQELAMRADLLTAETELNSEAAQKLGY